MRGTHEPPGAAVQLARRERRHEVHGPLDRGPVRASLVRPHRPGHVGAHDAGRELQHPQPAVVPREVQAGAEAHQRRLAEVVGARVGVVVRARAAVEVDHATAAARQHARHHVPRQQERAAHVGLQHRPPLVRVGRPQRHLGVDAPGVVDQQVHRTEATLRHRRLRAPDGGCDGPGVGHVARQRDGGPAEGAHLGGDLGQPARVPGQQRDVEPGAREAERDRAADAAGRARHERRPGRRDHARRPRRRLLLSHAAPPPPARRRPLPRRRAPRARRPRSACGRRPGGAASRRATSCPRPPGRR
ncbi:hypothetical protein ISCU110981_17640 [Isoptericola cucumis]